MQEVGGSSPPLGTKEGRIMRSFFVTSGDEDEVRRSDIRSEEGITRSVSPKDLNRSRFNPIPPRAPLSVGRFSFIRKFLPANDPTGTSMALANPPRER